MLMHYHSKQASIQLALVLKLNRINKFKPILTYQQLETIMNTYRWKNHPPISLANAIDDIFSLSDREIVIYLNQIAIKEATKQSISAYNDVINQ